MRTTSVSPGAAPRTATGPVKMCTPGPRSVSSIPRPDRPDAIVHQQVGRVAGVVGDGLDVDDAPASTSSTPALVAVDVAPIAVVRGGSESVGSGHAVDRTNRLFLVDICSMTGL